MSEDLDVFLDKWTTSIGNAMKMTADEQSRITGAGAEAYAKILHDHTPRSNEVYRRGRSAGHANKKHHNHHRKTKHLQDSITYKAGYTADGYHVGSSTDIGWEGHYYDFLAKILNNGSQRANTSAKLMRDIKFMDRAQQAAKKDVEAAELKAYKEVIGHDGG
jgi:hypothetical protein